MIPSFSASLFRCNNNKKTTRRRSKCKIGHQALLLISTSIALLWCLLGAAWSTTIATRNQTITADWTTRSTSIRVENLSTRRTIAKAEQSQNNNNNNDERNICTSFAWQIQRNSTWTRFDVNQLRRNVFLHHRYCIPSLLRLFARHYYAASPTTTKRSTKQANRTHVMLHIPKTAGSSICMFLRGQHYRIPRNSNNCFVQPHFAPVWCCAPVQTTHVQSLNCSAQEAVLSSLDISLNENWLDPDLCESQIYSMLLREPVARASSHIRHYVERTLAPPSLAKKPYLQAPSERAWRRRMIKSNYMTWALTAHQMSNVTHPVPTQALELANSRLGQMDVLLDLFLAPLSSSSCVELTLQWMGLYSQQAQRGPRLQHFNQHQASSNKRNSSQDQGDSSLDELRRLNAMDIQLYNLALKYMSVDCEFLKLMESSKSAE